MTLTAAQAEIVRRFVAGEDFNDLEEPTAGGVTPQFFLSEIQSALRLALVSKDAEIERLNGEIENWKEGVYRP